MASERFRIIQNHSVAIPQRRVYNYLSVMSLSACLTHTQRQIGLAGSQGVNISDLFPPGQAIGLNRIILRVLVKQKGYTLALSSECTGASFDPHAADSKDKSIRLVESLSDFGEYRIFASKFALRRALGLCSQDEIAVHQVGQSKVLEVITRAGNSGVTLAELNAMKNNAVGIGTVTHDNLDRLVYFGLISKRIGNVGAKQSRLKSRSAIYFLQRFAPKGNNCGSVILDSSDEGILYFIDWLIKIISRTEKTYATVEELMELTGFTRSVIDSLSTRIEAISDYGLELRLKVIPDEQDPKKVLYVISDDQSIITKQRVDSLLGIGCCRNLGTYDNFKKLLQVLSDGISSMSARVLMGFVTKRTQRVIREFMQNQNCVSTTLQEGKLTYQNLKLKDVPDPESQLAFTQLRDVLLAMQQRHVRVVDPAVAANNRPRETLESSNLPVTVTAAASVGPSTESSQPAATTPAAAIPANHEVFTYIDVSKYSTTRLQRIIVIFDLLKKHNGVMLEKQVSAYLHHQRRAGEASAVILCRKTIIRAYSDLEEANVIIAQSIEVTENVFLPVVILTPLPDVEGRIESFLQDYRNKHHIKYIVTGDTMDAVDRLFAGTEYRHSAVRKLLSIGYYSGKEDCFHLHAVLYSIVVTSGADRWTWRGILPQFPLRYLIKAFPLSTVMREILADNIIHKRDEWFGLVDSWMMAFYNDESLQQLFDRWDGLDWQLVLRGMSGMDPSIHSLGDLKTHLVEYYLGRLSIRIIYFLSLGLTTMQGDWSYDDIAGFDAMYAILTRASKSEMNDCSYSEVIALGKREPILSLLDTSLSFRYDPLSCAHFRSINDLHHFWEVVVLQLSKNTLRVTAAAGGWTSSPEIISSIMMKLKYWKHPKQRKKRKASQESLGGAAGEAAEEGGEMEGDDELPKKRPRKRQSKRKEAEQRIAEMSDAESFVDEQDFDLPDLDLDVAMDVVEGAEAEAEVDPSPEREQREIDTAAEPSQATADVPLTELTEEEAIANISSADYDRYQEAKFLIAYFKSIFMKHLTSLPSHLIIDWVSAGANEINASHVKVPLQQSMFFSHDVDADYFSVGAAYKRYFMRVRKHLKDPSSLSHPFHSGVQNDSILHHFKNLALNKRKYLQLIQHFPSIRALVAYLFSSTAFLQRHYERNPLLSSQRLGISSSVVTLCNSLLRLSEDKEGFHASNDLQRYRALHLFLQFYLSKAETEKMAILAKIQSLPSGPLADMLSDMWINNLIQSTDVQSVETREAPKGDQQQQEQSHGTGAAPTTEGEKFATKYKTISLSSNYFNVQENEMYGCYYTILRSGGRGGTAVIPSVLLESPVYRSVNFFTTAFVMSNMYRSYLPSAVSIQTALKVEFFNGTGQTMWEGEDRASTAVPLVPPADASDDSSLSSLTFELKDRLFHRMVGNMRCKLTIQHSAHPEFVTAIEELQETLCSTHSWSELPSAIQRIVQDAGLAGCSLAFLVNSVSLMARCQRGCRDCLRVIESHLQSSSECYACLDKAEIDTSKKRYILSAHESLYTSQSSDFQAYCPWMTVPVEESKSSEVNAPLLHHFEAQVLASLTRTPFQDFARLKLNFPMLASQHLQCLLDTLCGEGKVRRRLPRQRRVLTGLFGSQQQTTSSDQWTYEINLKRCLA